MENYNYPAVMKLLHDNSAAWNCSFSEMENCYVFTRRYQMRVYKVIVPKSELERCAPSETVKDIVMSFNSQLETWKEMRPEKKKKKPVFSAPAIFVPHRECSKKALTVQILEPFYNDLRLLAQSENIPVETIAAQCIEFALKTRKEK